MTDQRAEFGAVRDLIGRLHEIRLDPAHTALLLIDLQVLDASSEGSQAQRAKADGSWDAIAPYFGRVAQVAVPAVQQLIEAARPLGIPVMFTRCASMTDNLRDNGRRFREFGIDVPASSRDAELLDALDVQPGDLVFNKTTASVFWSTAVDRTLHQMAVDTLIVGGVVTSGCVESAVRDACDLDYGVVLVDDACADRTHDLHEDALKRLHRNFALVRSTADVVAELAAATQPSARSRT